MDPGVLTALITSGGLLVGGVVAVFVKRGSDSESAKSSSSNALVDQLQEQGGLDREAASKARGEADAARSMLAQAEERFRTQTASLWQQLESMQSQMEQLRRQYRLDVDERDAHIAALIAYINSGGKPPAPPWPPRTTP